MRITNSMTRVSAINAVQWVEGLEVPGGELVEVDGKIYLNTVREGFNTSEPAMADNGYTKALTAGNVVMALIEYASAGKAKAAKGGA